MQLNETTKNPFFDNILILGLKSDELNTLQTLDIDEIEKQSLKYKAVILHNYQSIYCPKYFNPEDEFYKKICEYSFPIGVINYSENININKKQYTTFCLKDNNSINNNKLKHVTCAYIQSGLKIADKNIIGINTGIVLISSIDIYECHKEILSHFIDIITNYFINNSTNETPTYKKSREIYINSIQPNRVFDEYRLLPLYFSFILNLTLDSNNNNIKKNICLVNISNNYFQNIFCKIIINSKKNNSILLLKEYDTSIILEKFYIDDLIKLYCALLLDKSIILLFNDYHEINILINSLLSLAYPMGSSKKYKINFIYNKMELQGQKLIKNDELNTLIGVYFTDDDDLSFLPEEGKTPSFASTNSNINDKNDNNTNNNENIQYLPYLNFYYSKNAFVYSIKDKKFINCPFNYDNLLSEEIINDIKSQLYFVLGEKLTINSDMNFDETDLGLIFDNYTCKKINTFLYLNLKIISIFFRAFLMIINGINSTLNFKYNFNNMKNDGVNNINDYFKNYNHFIKGNKFRQHLINSKSFQNFLIKYIKKYKSNNKYMFIYKTLNDIKNKNYFDMNNYLEKLFKEQTRNGIINYYNFEYINFEKYFIDFIKLKEKENLLKEYLLYPSPNFTLFQLINISKKLIDNNNTYCTENPYINYLETDISFLNKFQIYKIYNSVKTIQKKKINKLFPFKHIEPKMPNSNGFIVTNNNNNNNSNINNNSNNINSNNSANINNNINNNNKVENKEKIKNIPNFDNILSQILNGEEISNLKQEINKVESKRELCSESKKFKFKKIKKEPSPFQKLGIGTAVGRNSSYYNKVNNPFTKNSINVKDKKKILHLSNGNEIRKSTQSFREKKAFMKPKNKNNNNIGNMLGESDGQINNFKKRSSKRKYTYNLEEAHKAFKKLAISNNNRNINNNKDILQGPITSTKKYENNCGHLPKLAGDIDDELLSDDDSLK